MWFLLLLAIPLYLVVGLATARIIHGNKMDGWLSLPPEQRSDKRLNEIELELAVMEHNVCNLKYDVLASQGCDCFKRGRWEKLIAEKQYLKFGGLYEPAVDMKPVVTWPYVAAIEFVSSGRRSSGRKPKEIISGDFIEVPKEEAEHPLWTGYRDEQWQELNKKWDELLDMSRDDEILAKPLDECTADEILSVLSSTTKPRLEEISIDDLLTGVKNFSG